MNVIFTSYDNLQEFKFFVLTVLVQFYSRRLIMINIYYHNTGITFIYADNVRITSICIIIVTQTYERNY